MLYFGFYGVIEQLPFDYWSLADYHYNTDYDSMDEIFSPLGNRVIWKIAGFDKLRELREGYTTRMLIGRAHV